MAEEKTAKFQCLRIGSDFHVGDGRVIRGPYTVNYKDGTREDFEGEILEIPADIAAEGVKKKMGKIA